MKTIILKSAGSTLTLSAKNGAVRGLERHGRQHLKPAAELFTIRLQSGVRVKSSDFKERHFDGKSFHYTGHLRHPGLEIEAAIRDDQGFFRFRFTVKGAQIWWIDGPQLIAVDGGELLTPLSEGALATDATNRLKHFSPEYCFRSYPGLAQMQFMAHLHDGGGIYFGAHDPRHAPKKPVNYANRTGSLRLGFECFGEVPFDFVLGTFDGDWMEAATIYRDWVENLAQLVKNRKLPGWLDESPVMVVVTVRGGRDFSGEPNSYFPYINILPHINRIAEKVGGKILVMLMRWDQHGPWTPPYSWPPMGGADKLKELETALHDAGHRIGLYGSGATWTQRSLTTGYSSEKQFRGEKLASYMTRRPDGRLDGGTYPNLRTHYRMCLAEQWTRDVLLEQVREIARANMDVFQLFDQDHGGVVRYCYAKNHTHPPFPGPKTTRIMTTVLDEMQQLIWSEGKDMLIGTEAAPAEPFINGMPCNDLRMSLSILRGDKPVPLYQYIFHEYINNFMGNRAQIHECVDVEKSPDNLLWNIAFSFAAGDMLSLTLRPDGIIDWGAADCESTPPDQEQVLTLTRHLNAWRRYKPEFLRYGKMLKPLLKITGGKYTLYLRNHQPLEYDSFCQSSWESQDGNRVMFLINFLPRPQIVQCGSQNIELPPLDAIMIDFSRKPKISKAGKLKLIANTNTDLNIYELC